MDKLSEMYGKLLAAAAPEVPANRTEDDGTLYATRQAAWKLYELCDAIIKHTIKCHPSAS